MMNETELAALLARIRGLEEIARSENYRRPWGGLSFQQQADALKKRAEIV